MDIVTPVALDAGMLQVAFVASLGPLRVTGAFRSLRGELLLPHAGLAAASLAVEVDAASVDTGVAMRDRHLRARSFLDVAEHPTITFRSTKIAQDNGDLVVAGTLVLRGVARDIVTRCPIAPMGGDASQPVVSLCGPLDIPIRQHGIGVPLGLDVLNPIFLLVGARVSVRVRLALAVRRVPPALRPALAR
jgi:polyisoprenoid-binding protein YceI